MYGGLALRLLFGRECDGISIVHAESGIDSVTGLLGGPGNDQIGGVLFNVERDNGGWKLEINEVPHHAPQRRRNKQYDRQTRIGTPAFLLDGLRNLLSGVLERVWPTD